MNDSDISDFDVVSAAKNRKTIDEFSNGIGENGDDDDELIISVNKKDDIREEENLLDKNDDDDGGVSSKISDTSKNFILEDNGDRSTTTIAQSTISKDFFKTDTPIKNRLRQQKPRSNSNDFIYGSQKRAHQRSTNGETNLKRSKKIKELVEGEETKKGKFVVDVDSAGDLSVEKPFGDGESSSSSSILLKTFRESESADGESNSNAAIKGETSGETVIDEALAANSTSIDAAIDRAVNRSIDQFVQNISPPHTSPQKALRLNLRSSALPRNRPNDCDKPSIDQKLIDRRCQSIDSPIDHSIIDLQNNSNFAHQSNAVSVSLLPTGGNIDGGTSSSPTTNQEDQKCEGGNIFRCAMCDRRTHMHNAHYVLLRFPTCGLAPCDGRRFKIDVVDHFQKNGK